MLFSPYARKKKAAELHRTARSDAREAMHRYMRECVKLGVRPSAHATTGIYDSFMESKPRLTTGAGSILSKTRLEMYVDFVETLWRAIVGSPVFEQDWARFRLVNHVVGTLYMITGTFTLTVGTESYNIVDKDDFLSEHLPAQLLLQNWAVKTPQALESTSRVLAVKPVRMGRFPEFGRTGISTGRSVIKEALQSITSQETREEIVSLLIGVHAAFRDE